MDDFYLSMPEQVEKNKNDIKELKEVDLNVYTKKEIDDKLALLPSEDDIKAKANIRTKKLDLTFFNGLTTKDEYFKKIKSLLINNTDTSLLIYGTPEEFQPFWDVWTKPDGFKGTHVYLVITMVSNNPSETAFDFRLYPSNYNNCYFTAVHGLYEGYVGYTGWKDLSSKGGGGLQPVTEKSVVYATDGNAHQTTVQYNKTAVGGGLAQRNNDGTLEVAGGIRENDAVNKGQLDLKQDKLTAGTNITITPDGTISASGGGGGGGTQLYLHKGLLDGSPFEFITTTNDAFYDLDAFNDNNLVNNIICFTKISTKDSAPLGFFFRGTISVICGKNNGGSISLFSIMPIESKGYTETIIKL